MAGQTCPCGLWEVAGICPDLANGGLGEAQGVGDNVSV